MNTIEDIRLYKSNRQDDMGNHIIHAFGDKKLNAMVHRIVMKLRERAFSFGEFDHLYIDFTTCDLEGNMKLSNKVDKYHPWYRYCFLKVEDALYQTLGALDTYQYIIDAIGDVLIHYFATGSFDRQFFCSCIGEAMEQGENMLMKFKEKRTSKRKAFVYLRYLDTCRYFPLLRVYDTEDNLLLEKNLPEALTLDYLGVIQLSMKKVTINPRKNCFTTGMVPITIEYG